MLNKEQAERIEQAVKAAESATSSEISVCILPASGDDRGMAAIAAAIVFAAIQGGAPILWWGLDPLILTGAAIVAAILAFWLCDRFDLGLRWLPARLLIKDARRAARAAFLDHGLDNSPERNAVLLFVSRAERYVEILPDRAAAAAIEPAHWSVIVDEFRQRMRKADLGEAAAGAAAAIGKLCAVHFPSSGANPDRVSNQPIQG
ncbi:MAG TPA: TPM domain-containing protein [Dongiaceae bacterium]|nr:TPM domain-containing protein [Dongiaceae bacterium]